MLVEDIFGAVPANLGARDFLSRYARCSGCHSSKNQYSRPWCGNKVNLCKIGRRSISGIYS